MNEKPLDAWDNFFIGFGWFGTSIGVGLWAESVGAGLAVLAGAALVDCMVEDWIKKWKQP